MAFCMRRPAITVFVRVIVFADLDGDKVFQKIFIADPKEAVVGIVGEANLLF